MKLRKTLRTIARVVTGKPVRPKRRGRRRPWQTRRLQGRR